MQLFKLPLANWFKALRCYVSFAFIIVVQPKFLSAMCWIINTHKINNILIVMILKWCLANISLIKIDLMKIKNNHNKFRIYLFKGFLKVHFFQSWKNGRRGEIPEAVTYRQLCCYCSNFFFMQLFCVEIYAPMLFIIFFALIFIS